MTALQDRLQAFSDFAAAQRLGAQTAGAASQMGHIANWAPTGSTDITQDARLFLETAMRAAMWSPATNLEDDDWLRLTNLAVLQIRDTPDLPRSSKASPFDEIDERRDVQKKLAELILHIQRSPTLPYARELAKRIDRLVQIAIEEAPYQSLPSADSLRGLVRFLYLHPNLLYPDVMLAPSGNVRVQWRAARNKLCAVEFHGHNRVHFVIFAPDPDQPSDTIRLSGSTSVESFLSTVRPHGALDWMQR